jgi:uncharacterized protein YbaR (Trm112 family)
VGRCRREGTAGMWHCSQCGEKNENQFEVCWKCQAAQDNVEDTSLEILFDPDKPQSIGENGAVACPTCGQQFRVQTGIPQEASAIMRARRSDAALCPHCGHTVTPELLVRVVAAKRDASAPPVREVMYACPYCGKVLSISEGAPPPPAPAPG